MPAQRAGFFEEVEVGRAGERVGADAHGEPGAEQLLDGRDPIVKPLVRTGTRDNAAGGRRKASDVCRPCLTDVDRGRPVEDSEPVEVDDGSLAGGLEPVCELGGHRCELARSVAYQLDLGDGFGDVEGDGRADLTRKTDDRLEQRGTGRVHRVRREPAANRGPHSRSAL